MISILPRDLVTAAAATGAVAAGVVLFEAALVPVLVIGAAAVLVPRFLQRRGGAAETRQGASASSASWRDMLPKSLGDLAHVRFSQAVVKTITFRVIVTGLDFTANYLILREPMTAAGLSAISIVGGPLFYFVHESTWNYLVGSGKIDLESRAVGPLKLLKNRPIVKTITYRTLATVIEFTTNYVVVRDLGTAALLSSFGFFLGPFVYYGHELAWERLGPKSDKTEAARRPGRRGARVIIDVEPIPVPSS